YRRKWGGIALPRPCWGVIRLSSGGSGNIAQAWAGREACYMAALAGKSCTASFVSDNAGAPDTKRTVVIGSLLISGKVPALLATAARQPPNLPPQFWGLLGVRPLGSYMAS